MRTRMRKRQRGKVVAYKFWKPVELGLVQLVVVELSTVTRGTFFRSSSTFIDERWNPSSKTDSSTRFGGELSTGIYVKQRDDLSIPKQKRYHEFYSRERSITLNGHDIPDPIRRLDEAPFPGYMIDYIKKQGFKEPTVVQAQSWPIALSGYNMVCRAQSGSGKIYSYILPALLRINCQKKISSGIGPITLVLAPTKKRVWQIYSIVEKIGKLSNVNSIYILNYISKQKMYKLFYESDICITTPKYLNYLLHRIVVKMHRCMYLVLDRADYMFDTGMCTWVCNVIDWINPNRQVLMSLSKYSTKAYSFANKYIPNYIHLDIINSVLSVVGNRCTSRSILQIVDVVERYEKGSRLRTVLDDIISNNVNKNNVIIYVETKIWAKKLTEIIALRYHLVECIDDSEIQQEICVRTENRKSGTIFVTTDNAARNLDINGVKYLINYDFPSLIQNYVARINKINCLDEKATSYIFFTPQNRCQAKDLIDILKKTNQFINPALFKFVEKYSEYKYDSYEDENIHR